MAVTKSKAEVPTIDVALVTIKTTDGEFGFKTANQIAVEPQVEEQEAIKLIVKGVLLAQKPKESTLTGHQITLTDNVFNPELVLVLQGGTITYDDTDTDKVVGYTPPIVGSGEKGEDFSLAAYSAVYNPAGQIVEYERIEYPNCVGSPIAFSSEDGAFRAPEYVIFSAPKENEAPYELTYVDTLPTLT